MREELAKALEKQNHIHGHASVEPAPRRAVRVRLKCDVYCSGNAVARFVCAVCHVGLCRRHAYIAKDGQFAGQAFCKEHRQGWI